MRWVYVCLGAQRDTRSAIRGYAEAAAAGQRRWCVGDRRLGCCATALWRAGCKERLLGLICPRARGARTPRISGLEETPGGGAEDDRDAAARTRRCSWFCWGFTQQLEAWSGCVRAERARPVFFGCRWRCTCARRHAARARRRLRTQSVVGFSPGFHAAAGDVVCLRARGARTPRSLSGRCCAALQCDAGCARCCLWFFDAAWCSCWYVCLGRLRARGARTLRISGWRWRCTRAWRHAARNGGCARCRWLVFRRVFTQQLVTWSVCVRAERARPAFRMRTRHACTRASYEILLRREQIFVWGVLQ